MTQSLRRRLLVGAGLAAGVALLLAAAYHFDFLATARVGSTDLLFQSRPRDQARAVAIVAIDQRSYRELLPIHGPLVRWPRTVYATALDRLRPDAPRIVIFDVLFDAPRPEDDGLIAAIRRAGNVLVPVEAQGPREFEPAPGVAQAFDAFVGSTQAIRRAAAAEGFVNVTTDHDTVVRRLPLMLRSAGEDVPALALTAVARFVRRRTVLDGPPDAHRVHAAGRAIPLVGHGQMLINFLGPPSTPGVTGAVPMIPLVDVLNGTFDRTLVRDKIILVGLTIRGVDEHATPTTGAVRMWGVEVLANAIETILGERYLAPIGPAATVAILFTLAALAALLAVLWRPLLAALGTLGLLAFYLVTAAVLFDHGIVLDLVFAPAAVVLAAAAALIYRVGFEQREQRRVRGVMARYLSPSVSQWVLQDPTRLRLGGETREMTVLFCDLRGFTALSHALDPQTLVRLINEFMTAMTEVVFRHDGVLDKYVGDAIMAFWNAPVSQPNHAGRACQTALDMVARLRTLVADWTGRGWPALQVGIGVNTGPMVVGNMGSRARLAYTVMGDTVNVASRLEGLSKRYGTQTVVGEATRKSAGDAFAYRFLDVVALKGRREPLTVYELLGRRRELDAPTVELVESYERGIALYRDRRWREAARLFAELHARVAADGPTALYHRRTQALLEVPPPPDWDGVFEAETK